MPTPKMPDEDADYIWNLWQVPGATTRTVAATSGYGETTCRAIRRDRLKAAAKLPTGRVAAVPKAAVEEMRAAAGPEVEEWDESPEQVWKHHEERAKRAIRRAQEGSTFRWTAPGKHLLLTVLSDMHIGGSHTDYERMRLDAMLIRDTPNCFCVLVGDQVDNHIKHRGAMLTSESVPEKQYLMFEYWLRIAGDKTLVVTSGNHDDWTVSHAGVDVLGRVVRDRRVFYSPNEAWLELSVGGQKYTVGVRHQYHMNSRINQTHAVKQWLRFGGREFDVGIIGHHHEHALEATLYRGRNRYVARPGSYQRTSGYSDAAGFNHAVPTCPTFLLRGDAHGLTAWNSLKDMAESARAIKELGAV